MNGTNGPFVQRIALRNYKSIQRCDVHLHSLILLVGPNGSGKSNFLDALRFVAESLRTTMDQALRERGGIKEVRRRSRGHPTHFSIKLWLKMPTNTKAEYGFRVGAKRDGGFEIQEEQCRILTEKDAILHSYSVRNGIVEQASFQPRPPSSTERLYLTLVAGLPGILPLYESLSGMGFYNINPGQLRELQDPDSGDLSLRDGRNAASVLSRLQERSPQVKQRVEDYLGQIVPGVRHVDKESLGHKETLSFRQVVAGDKNPWGFPAQNMSDGTLRALGVLLALFQCFDRPPRNPIPLIGIEEPEIALHPAAAGILMDALLEAAHFTQVVVTTHSPELLDLPDLDPESLLVVDAAEGETIVAPADDASIAVLRDRLYTAGELLKLAQLKPRALPFAVENGDPNAVNSQSDYMPLFPE